MAQHFNRTPGGENPGGGNERSGWFHLQTPDPAVIGMIPGGDSLPAEFFTDPLDVDERARIDSDAETRLIIVRIPVRSEAGDSVPFVTLPLGIIFSKDVFVTVGLPSAEIVCDLVMGNDDKFVRDNTERWALRVLLRTSLAYLKALKQIHSRTNLLENDLQKSIRNEELLKLMDLEKSLVFFTTSLRSNELMLERLKSTALVRKTPDNSELFDDVVIETRQAIAMADVYSNILSGMMDAFASIISNNLNVVMKFLTSVTIILMLPTLVVSVYGMNLPLPFQHSQHAFLIVIGLSVMLAILGVIVFIKQKLF